VARRSRSKSNRTHQHSDQRIAVPARSELDLVAILDKLAEPFLLVLDGIQDPHNLGACLRTADAAGVHAVIAPRHRAVALTDTVRTVACGAAETVPFVQVTNISRTLSALQARQIWTVGTTDAGAKTIFDVDLRGSLAIVVGAEGQGARRLTLERCDHAVSIPMAGSVECLNVSVAAGICLFEAVRQRRMR
jgi:23S rRNA (guanosine2251-2'-O)-methyltransferase